MTKGRAVLALLGIVVVHVSIATWWMHAFGFLTRPPTTEAAFYRFQAVRGLQALDRDGVLESVSCVATFPETRTFLFPLLAGWLSLPAEDGVTPADQWRVLVLFGGLFIIGTYRVARHLLGREAAIAVAALTVACPIVVAYQRPFYPQFPMMALVLWSLDALLRSRGFRDMKWSLLFGFLIGLATLTKVIAPLYVGGSALAALLLHSPRDWRSLRSALLAALVAAAVVGPWLFPKLHHVTAYTQHATDEGDTTRDMTGLWTANRWLYYPRHFVDAGVGLPLAVLAAASAAVLLATRSKAVANRRTGSILLFGVGVTWPVLTFGQAAGESQYVLVWAPLTMMLLVLGVTRLGGNARRGAVVVLILASLWSLWLSYRGPYEDRAFGPIKGVHLIPKIDSFITGIPVTMQMTPRPEAEPWPVADYTRIILDAVPVGAPRVATTHPFLCSWNLAHDAWLEDRRIVEVNVTPLLRGTRELRWLAAIDFAVLDPAIPMLDPDAVCHLMTQAGLSCTILDRRAVTSERSVALVRLQRPWERLAWVSAGAARPPTMRSCDIRFPSGWRIAGIESHLPPILEGARIVHVYLAGDAARGDAVLLVEHGRRESRSRLASAATPPGRRGGFRVVSFEIPPSAPGSPPPRLFLCSDDGNPEIPASSDLPHDRDGGLPLP
jgi:hypothetical protein